MGLTYLKDFESFTKEDCQRLMEGLQDKDSHRLDKAFEKIGRVPLSNGSYFDTKDIVKYVNDAIDMMGWEWGSFYSFVQNFTIIYIINDPQIRTMAVDGHLNMYIDALFVYNLMHTYSPEGETRKDKDAAYKKNLMLVGAIIMHEVFHVVFNHIERGERWCISQNKKLDRRAQHDNNLAADIEVNTALMKKNILDIDRIEKIGALYLKELSSNVPPMEEILENEKLMEKLRKMHPFQESEQGGQGGGNENEEKQETIETTSEFDEGYVEMMNKIAELVNEYGPEETIKKLREVGAVAPNATPRLGADFSTDDVLSLSFIQIKTFDTFINESKEKPNAGEDENENQFKTREQGRLAAVQRAIDAINQAMFGGEEGGGGGMQGPVPKTNIDQSKLTPMNLPGNNKKSEGGEGGEGLPINKVSNDESDGKDGKNSNRKNGKNSDGKDGKNSDGKDGKQSKSGESGEQSSGGSGGGQDGKLTDGKAPKSNIDITYKDKPRGGNYGDTIESSSVGKTGTFINEDDESRFDKAIERTYGKELAKDVKQIVGENRSINTKEVIEKKKNDFYNKVATGTLKDIWDNAAASEKKYMAMWKKILKKFLKETSRQAEIPKEADSIRWGERRHMSIGQITPYQEMKYRDRQDINVYIDVSGSVWQNMELMKLMAESLVSFMKAFKYSGINLVAWASETGDIHKVESLAKKGETAAVAEITSYIESMGDSLGGGTDIDKCVDGIVNTTFQYKNRKQKDDAHVIITDGEIDYGKLPGLERQIMREISSKEGKDDDATPLGKTIVKNCIWIVYDNENEAWDKGINKGQLVRISSKNIIPS